MFTFKPASKNGSKGNGYSNGNGNGNGHSNGNGNGHSNGNGASRTPISGWLGLGGGHKNGDGNGNGNGHANGNGHSTKIESVLGPGIHFQGNFTGVGGIRIEGTFDGNINVKGPVAVADGARVTGDIQGLSVSVAGSVQGNITAHKVEIRSTGRIFGDLVTTTFATDEGAFLRGLVRMEDNIAAPAQLAAPQAALADHVSVASEPVSELAA